MFLAGLGRTTEIKSSVVLGNWSSILKLGFPGGVYERGSLPTHHVVVGMGYQVLIVVTAIPAGRNGTTAGSPRTAARRPPKGWPSHPAAAELRGTWWCGENLFDRVLILTRSGFSHLQGVCQTLNRERRARFTSFSPSSVSSPVRVVISPLGGIVWSAHGIR